MAIRVSNVSFQVLLSPTVFERFVQQDLALLEEPFRRKLRVENVTFQALLLPDPPSIDLTQEIAFVDSVEDILYIGDFVGVPDPITFVQELDLFGLELVSDPITFVDEALCDLHSTMVEDFMPLTDVAEVYNGVPWLGPFVLHQLDFSWNAGVGYPIHVEHEITFVQSMFRKFPVEHTLSFVQTVTVGIGQTDIHQIVTFEHEVSTAGSQYTRIATDVDFIRHSFTYYTDGPCVLKTYNRFDGEGDGGGISEPRLYSPDWKFTLETMTGPKVILQLRNPSTDDRDRLGFNRINRETRGGEINIYSDPSWPRVNTLLFTVVALKREKIDALQDFLLSTLGQEIKLHDWTGTTWVGVVTTPGEVAVEDGVSAWTISFEFEGVPYPGQAPDAPLQFAQAVGVQGIFGRSGSDAVAFVQTAFGYIILTYEEELESELTFGQDVQNILQPDNAEAFGRVTGIGNIDAEGYFEPSAFGEVEGIGNIDADGYFEPSAFGEVEGVGELDGVGYFEPSAFGEVEGIGNIDAQGVIDLGAYGVITGIGEIDAVGHREPVASGEVEGIGNIDAEGETPPDPVPQVDIYTADDTWNKPDGAISVQVICVGGGAGGGSGRVSDTNPRTGGGGGGGGGFSYDFFDAGDLGSSETVTIGAGGTGGASHSTSDTDGNTGGAGGTTSFGAHVSAGGGTAGEGGTGATSVTAVAGGTGDFAGGAGGARSATPAARDGGNSLFGGGAGGAAGGTNGSTAGGDGGDTFEAEVTLFDIFPTLTAVLGATTDGGNGDASVADVPTGGGGGAGGTTTTTANAGDGGDGGNYGAGGGGGGSCNNTFTSGAGGDGADGVCIVITYFV